MRSKDIMFGYNNVEGMPHAYDKADLSEDYVKSILVPLNLQKGSRILDLACGRGYEAAAIKELSGATVIESDLNSEAFYSNSNPDRKFVAADIQALPFAENSFDLVHIKDGLVHIDDKRSFFDKVYKILKPGGNLLLVTNCSRKIVEGRLGFFVISQGMDTSQLNFASLDEYSKLVEERTEYLKEKGVKNVEVSLPYFQTSKELIERIANNSGFEKVEGVIPDGWVPRDHEKNWGHFIRHVFLFKKKDKDL